MAKLPAEYATRRSRRRNKDVSPSLTTWYREEQVLRGHFQLTRGVLRDQMSSAEATVSRYAHSSSTANAVRRSRHVEHIQRSRNRDEVPDCRPIWECEAHFLGIVSALWTTCSLSRVPYWYDILCDSYGDVNSWWTSMNQKWTWATPGNTGCQGSLVEIKDHEAWLEIILWVLYAFLFLFYFISHPPLHDSQP